MKINCFGTEPLDTSVLTCHTQKNCPTIYIAPEMILINNIIVPENIVINDIIVPEMIVINNIIVVDRTD